MLFVVGGEWPKGSAVVGRLERDNWDDWFRFETTLILSIRTRGGEVHRIGSLKIGESPMKGRSADLPTQFESLPARFFSLGQDETYYERLNELGDEVRDQVLQSLNDVAADPELFDRFFNEPVMGGSLLRFVSPTTVSGQYHRMAKGGARLSAFSFNYTTAKNRRTRHDPIQLSFRVEPESVPPTNVHVLIGRNGVGKTHLLNQMARAVVGGEDEREVGGFSIEGTGTLAAGNSGFANVVSVTFSAFDPFLPLGEKRDKTKGTQYSYIGLKRTLPKNADRSRDSLPKSPQMLASEFSRSMLLCLQGPRRARWDRALKMLESDPVFSDVGISELADLDVDDDELAKESTSTFNRLSSGHKIVLLSITRLVETVEERSLVLIDEPEAHLHPPLLAAFVRSLSDLLINRNGVAIVATHSPVLLQEVPRSCVWMIRRTGMRVDAERPSLETFGENVGILTREVFGLEVTHSGYNRLLAEAVQRADSYEDAIALFDGELGGEALALLQSYFVARQQR
jgi:predicted ATPase